MTIKERMYGQIQAHGECLKALFNLPADTDGVKLCKALRRLEAEAGRYAEACCNGDPVRFRGRTIPFHEMTEEMEENIEADILRRVKALFNGSDMESLPIFLNTDPRGYALKIDDSWIRAISNGSTDEKASSARSITRDMGGYGILAPEFTGKEDF